MSIELAQDLMDEFALTTGIIGTSPPRRYLWTDAFAVCNFLGLERRMGTERNLALAEALILQVHHELGRHRSDSPVQGWISGLAEDEGERHPTRGGLRIGKKLNERSQNQPPDPSLEWDRDGQYFHYLTRWMHALHCGYQQTGRQNYLDWAAELAIVAENAFTYELASNRPKRMVWKMSIDLSRPLVDSMGHHDPLDGLITCLELYREPGLSEELKPGLSHAMEDFQQMCRHQYWTTDDPLGIGGLLDAAIRLLQIDRSRSSEYSELLLQLFEESKLCVRHFSRSRQLEQPPEYRLAFRELGLSIGLRGLELFASDADRNTPISGLLQEILEYRWLAEQIETFWRDPQHRQSRNWIDHKDITSVMLATSLVPDGYFNR